MGTCHTPLEVYCYNVLVHLAFNNICLQYYFSTGLSALMIASKHGRYDEAKLLLEKGAQVDLQDSKGWCALMFAVQEGHLELVKLLLEYGANVDLQTLQWESALSLALLQECPEMFTFIKVSIMIDIAL